MSFEGNCSSVSDVKRLSHIAGKSVGAKGPVLVEEDASVVEGSVEESILELSEVEDSGEEGSMVDGSETPSEAVSALTTNVD